MSSATQQINDVLVRPARAGDAAEVANVHINSWREAYRGLLPPEFLDELPQTFRRRMHWWEEVLTQPDKHALFVAEHSSGLVGFSCFGSARDHALRDHGELGAIYLFERFQKIGVGAVLLKLGFERLKQWNYTKAYCWVLEGNPTIRFYERSGAVAHGMTKDETIGGKNVRELAYVWGAL